MLLITLRYKISYNLLFAHANAHINYNHITNNAHIYVDMPRFILDEIFIIATNGLCQIIMIFWIFRSTILPPIFPLSFVEDKEGVQTFRFNNHTCVFTGAKLAKEWNAFLIYHFIINFFSRTFESRRRSASRVSAAFTFFGMKPMRSITRQLVAVSTIPIRNHRTAS